MEMATIGGSQDERERWPQEYTTMPYTYTHMQSSSQLPDMGWGRWAVARTGGVAGAGGKDRSWYPGSLPGPCSGIGEQRTGQNCACNQFQVCAARGLFEKAIPLPHYPISPAHFHPPPLSSEKYATLSSWTRLCCCCFISPLPCLPSHTTHPNLESGRFGQVKSK